MKKLGLVGLLGFTLMGCASNGFEPVTTYNCITTEGEESFVMEAHRDEATPDVIALSSNGEITEMTRVEAASGEKFSDETGLLVYSVKGSDSVFEFLGEPLINCSEQ